MKSPVHKPAPPRARLALMLSLASSLIVLPVASAANDGGDAAYVRIAHQFFYEGFKESPSGATSTGVHTYDAQLDDESAAAFAAHFAREHGVRDSLEAIDPATLSPDVALDRTILLNSIDDDLLVNEKLANWRHNPDSYVGTASNALYALISRDFAPPEVRLRDAIARERKLPLMFAQAKADLTTVDAASKEVAADDADGAVGFFAGDVPEAFAGVHDPALQAQFRSATATAVAATRAYAAFVKRIVPQGTFAIGKDAYEARLRYDDALDVPVSKYLSYGWKALHATRAQFVATAKLIDPTKAPPQVLLALTKVHPTPAELKPAATRDLVQLRAFLVSHHIITLPPDGNIVVIDTPGFERATTTAAMDSPGPLETVATRAYYNVTPVDPSWPASRKEGFLEQFNDFQRPIISAHEVYPGHFVNFILDKHLQLSLTRKLLWNSEFGEGWAHYGEQMMVDQGWGNGNPRVRLVQLDEALLRECRYVVGVELHTGGWSLARAQQLFRDECFQTQATASEESLRGTQDPMYGYYTLGKLMILKLRADYQRKLGPAYTLQKFHDALLAHGDPPVPLLRPFLLGPQDDGSPL